VVYGRERPLMKKIYRKFGKKCGKILRKEKYESPQNIPCADVPDMPDRIITATAYQLDLPLITKDQKIKNSRVVSVVW
jgi:predicted nucleic acid-binding protein